MVTNIRAPIVDPAVISYWQSCLVTNKIAPVYLLVGPAHIGKLTLAIWLTQSLFCEAKTNKPCGQCSACYQVKTAVHPDLIKINLNEDRRDIGIEQVRMLQDQLSQSSILGGRRVAIITNAERLSLPAANATLKLLEESHGGITIFLLADNLATLPETVVSRCQIIRLNPLASQFIKQFLIQEGVSNQVADELAVMSYGRPGLAINWLDNMEQIAQTKEMGDQLIKLLSSPSLAWPVIEKLIKENQSLTDWQAVVWQWQLVVHEAVLYKLTLLKVPTAASVAVVKQLSNRSFGQLFKLWTFLVNLGHNLDKNINIRTFFESLVLQNLSYE